MMDPHALYLMARIHDIHFVILRAARRRVSQRHDDDLIHRASDRKEIWIPAPLILRRTLRRRRMIDAFVRLPYIDVPSDPKLVPSFLLIVLNVPSRHPLHRDDLALSEVRRRQMFEIEARATLSEEREAAVAKQIVEVC